MALIASGGADRASQLIALTERLTDLVIQETALIQAYQPPLTGPAGEEKARLANLYRQEMTAIAQQKDLLAGAPGALVDRLRTLTVQFQTALADHARALAAVKEISEGIVRVIAEEVARAKTGPRGYRAGGAYAPAPAAAGAALALNQTA